MIAPRNFLGYKPLKDWELGDKIKFHSKQDFIDVFGSKYRSDWVLNCGWNTSGDMDFLFGETGIIIGITPIYTSLHRDALFSEFRSLVIYLTQRKEYVGRFMYDTEFLPGYKEKLYKKQHSWTISSDMVKNITIPNEVINTLTDFFNKTEAMELL
jgi:hypothetical protein